MTMSAMTDVCSLWRGFVPGQVCLRGCVCYQAVEDLAVVTQLKIFHDPLLLHGPWAPEEGADGRFWPRAESPDLGRQSWHRPAPELFAKPRHRVIKTPEGLYQLPLERRTYPEKHMSANGQTQTHVQLHWPSEFGISKILNVFGSLFCSSRLHLFDQKYRNTVILWNIITI